MASRSLTGSERTKLVAFLCRQPSPPAFLSCSDQAHIPAWIVFGSFSRADADEAVVTYLNADNSQFGGGALLTRFGDGWRLARWTRVFWSSCVTVPRIDPNRLLRAHLGGNMGEYHSQVDVESLRADGESDSGSPLMSASDVRNATFNFNDPIGRYGCSPIPAGRAKLMDVLPTSARDGPSPFFARVRLDYLTASAIALACRGSTKHAPVEGFGYARFFLRNGRIEIDPPARFVRP